MLSEGENKRLQSRQLQTDFAEFAKRIGVTESGVEELLHPFIMQQKLVEKLTSHSFLNDADKRAYLLLYIKPNEII